MLKPTNCMGGVVKMDIKKYSKTKYTLLLLLSHFAYIIVFIFFMFMASILEFPCNRDGIYMMFAVISIVLLCIYPIAATIINVMSIVFAALAIKSHESKLGNVILMIIAILYELAVILFFIRFWQGTMGV